MIKRTKITFKDGTEKTQIRVMRSVRTGPEKKPRQITVRSFGYLEDQEDREAFLREVERVNENLKSERRKSMLLNIPSGTPNRSSLNRELNYGYRYIESVMEALHIKEFFNGVEFKGGYSLYEAFSFLVTARILEPGSIRKSYSNIDRYYGKEYDLTLADLYRSLDKISENSVKLQAHVNREIKYLCSKMY